MDGPAQRGEGIVGQPEPHIYFHRPLNELLGVCFQAGFVMDGIEEPAFGGGPVQGDAGLLELPRQLKPGDEAAVARDRVIAEIADHDGAQDRDHDMTRPPADFPQEHHGRHGITADSAPSRKISRGGARIPSFGEALRPGSGASAGAHAGEQEKQETGI